MSPIYGYMMRSSTLEKESDIKEHFSTRRLYDDPCMPSFVLILDTKSN